MTSVNLQLDKVQSKNETGEREEKKKIVHTFELERSLDLHLIEAIELEENETAPAPSTPSAAAGKEEEEEDVLIND